MRGVMPQLAAGKHVLCEKPFTANAAETREIAEVAATSERVVMEAFHSRYHPLALRTTGRYERQASTRSARSHRLLRMGRDGTNTVAAVHDSAQSFLPLPRGHT
jgi:Oxidoreductase family, NAD-binding Rossmann fold